MPRIKEVLISTLLSSVMMVEGWAVFSHPKVAAINKVMLNKEITQVQVTKLETQDPEPQAALAALPQAKEDELQLELLGTAIGNIKDPIAFIKNLESNKQGIYRIGAKIKDAEVIKIVLGEVVLERNGKKETLRMSKRARNWAKMNDSEIFISRSQDLITVSRSGLFNQTSQILSMLPGLKFKPYYEEGKAKGLAVEGIADESLVKEAGLQNRDIIRTVNGHTINSYQKALQVAAKVQNQSEIRVSIQRDGKVQDLCYRIAK